MRNIINQAATAAIAVAVFGSVLASPAQCGGSLKDPAEQSTVVWSGVDGARGSYDIYGGGITALNGDISKNDILLRADGTYVNLKEGDVWQGDALAGYQVAMDSVTISGFMGFDYQRLPGSSNGKPLGDEAGFKVAAAIETDRNAAVLGTLLADYSTAFDTYWTKGRIGYNVKDFVIGPEGGFSGNEYYRASKMGGFISIPVTSFVGRTAALDLSGGYQWVTSFDNGGTGVATGSTVGATGGYVSVGLSILF